MILKFAQKVRLFRIVDRRKRTMEDVMYPAGQYKFVEVQNPDGPKGSPWLVLETDQAVGMAKQALLMKEGVSEVPAAA